MSLSFGDTPIALISCSMGGIIPFWTDRIDQFSDLVVGQLSVLGGQFHRLLSLNNSETLTTNEWLIMQ